MTKRDVLRVAAGLGVGTLGIAATSDNVVAGDPEDSVEKASDNDKEHVIETIKKSDQYDAVEDMVIDGDFKPQFEDSSVYELDKEGYIGIIPTENQQNDSLNVEIESHIPKDDNDGGIKIQVKVNDEDRLLGMLYANESTVEDEEDGYKEKFPESPESDELSPHSLPGWSDIREAADSVVDSGQEVISGTADTFTDTADYLQDELSDGVDEAYEQSEALFDSVELDPTPDEDPPEDLVDEMDEIGAEHVETIDMNRACFYVGLTITLGAAKKITLTGIGAGAGTLVVVAAGSAITLGACQIFDLVETFGADIDCSFDYAYVFEEKGAFGNTENWYIAVPCE